MKKLILIICLFYSSLFSLEIKSSDIDVTKKGIALGTYLSLNRAQNLANKFTTYSIYIKKTTTTIKPYFVVYAVNINKKDKYIVINKIKQIVPSAYIASDSRIKSFYTIKSSVASAKSVKVNTKEKINYIDSKKDSVTIKYAKDIFAALEIAESLKKFNIYIRSFKLLEENAFMIYAVNIPKNKYKDSIKEIQKLYQDSFKTSKDKVLYFSNNIDEDNSFLYSTKKDFPEVLKTRVAVNKSKNSKYTGSANSKYIKAKKLYSEKNYKETIKILENLSENNLENVGINFYLGRSYYETKDYERASAAFERVDMLSSNNLRAKLELSQSYLMLGLYNEATSGFNEVLKSNIPISVRENITKRIEHIDSLKKRGSFYGSVSLGYTYDNNINNITDTKLFDTPSYPNLTITDKQYSDSYLSLILNANYNYKINLDYSINNGINFVKQNYSKDDQRSYDLTSDGITKENKKELQLLSYNLQLSKSNKNSLISIGSDLSDIKVANDDYLKVYGINIVYQKRYLSNMSFFSSFKVSKKLYAQETNKNLNSKNYQLMIGQSVPTNEYGTFNLVYYNTQENRIIADTNAPDKVINGLLLGNRYKITDKLSTNLLYLYNHTKEKSDDATFEVERDDLLNTLSVGVDYKLNKTLSVTSNIKQIDNESNINIYSYDKRTFDIFFKKIF